MDLDYCDTIFKRLLVDIAYKTILLGESDLKIFDFHNSIEIGIQFLPNEEHTKVNKYWKELSHSYADSIHGMNCAESNLRSKGSTWQYYKFGFW